METTFDILDPYYVGITNSTETFAITPAKRIKKSGWFFNPKVEVDIVWCVLNRYDSLNNIDFSVETLSYWRVIKAFDYCDKESALNLLSDLKEEVN